MLLCLGGCEGRALPLPSDSVVACGWRRPRVSLAPERLAFAALCHEFVKLQTVHVTRAVLMPLLRQPLYSMPVHGPDEIACCYQ